MPQSENGLLIKMGVISVFVRSILFCFLLIGFGFKDFLYRIDRFRYQIRTDRRICMPLLPHLQKKTGQVIGTEILPLA